MASLQPHYPPFPQYLIQERARVKKQLLSATQGAGAGVHHRPRGSGARR